MSDDPFPWRAVGTLAANAGMVLFITAFAWLTWFNLTRFFPAPRLKRCIETALVVDSKTICTRYSNLYEETCSNFQTFQVTKELCTRREGDPL